MTRGWGGSRLPRPSPDHDSLHLEPLLLVGLRLQVTSKADNEEVMRALSAVGTKLRKISATLPALEDALSGKMDRKDLSK